jgi:hypothetical protein
MRSSKQRQRNKQTRQSRPSGGNIINRVFDSSGPEGKVRGTPQQIIEKYLQLHRDAQLAGDRVNAENFAQHAEHYTRLLAEAQRDVDRAREEQEQFHRERQQERDRQFEQSREPRPERDQRPFGEQRQSGDQRPDREFRADRDQRPFNDQRQAGSEPRPEQRDQRPDRDPRDREPRDRDFNRDRPRFRPVEEAPASEPSFLTQPLFPVLVAQPEDDSAPALVETPEERVQSFRDRPRRERRPRREEVPPVTPLSAAPEAPAEAAPVEPQAEEPPKAARKPRKPRTPRAEAEPTPDAAE